MEERKKKLTSRGKVKTVSGGETCNAGAFGDGPLTMFH